jgi:GNAT superfamily N-acetyltransferase
MSTISGVSGHPNAQIRRATLADAETLTDLTMRSLGHWGYDERFLEFVYPMVSVKPDFISDRLIYVLEDLDRIVGYLGLRADVPESELHKLFVELDAIGHGYGRFLWQRSIELASQLGMRVMVNNSDPNAVAFYRAVGAELVGTVPIDSPIPGWALQVLHYDVPVVTDVNTFAVRTDG